jgi:hypothetical protein
VDHAVRAAAVHCDIGSSRRTGREVVERALPREPLLPEVPERLLPEAEAVRFAVQVLRAE